LSSRQLSKNVKIRIYKTVILPVVLYGCETWSLILREESRLRVFENRVLRRIFGPKRGEVTGGWIKLHNEVHHNLYSSPSVIRMIKSRMMIWALNVAQVGDSTYRTLIEKPEGKGLVGRPRCSWMENIKMVLREIVWGGMNWIDLVQDREQWRALVNTVMNLRIL
jgi:hypothetical protein